MGDLLFDHQKGPSSLQALIRSVCMSRHGVINIVSVSLFTLASRVLGLARDILTATLLGAGSTASAFLFAFALPNLFRRLLGEGALTSAFIPLLASEADRGKQEVFLFANRVLSWAIAVLGLLVIVGIAGNALLVWMGARLAGSEEAWLLARQWLLGGQLGMLLMPYMALVCIAAQLGAILNIFNRFSIHALSSVWLNLSMIVALTAAGVIADLSPDRMVWCLAFGVLAGGLLQLLVPATCLLRIGWNPRLDWKICPQMRTLFDLLIPGLVGAGVAQANVLVSRLFAFGTSPDAVAILYLANRLVELPFGVFVMAVSTVFFPQLSRCAQENNRPVDFKITLSNGLEMVWAVTLPAAAGLIAMAPTLVSTLFGYGRFADEAVAGTVPVLAIFAAALPCYGVATLQTRAFHACRDMRSPVRIAAVSFGINLTLSALLAPTMAATGLAIANTASAIVHAWMLSRLFRQTFPERSPTLPFQGIIIYCVAAVAMGCAIHGLDNVLQSNEFNRLWRTLILVPVGCVIYALFVAPFRSKQWQTILKTKLQHLED